MVYVCWDAYVRCELVDAMSCLTYGGELDLGLNVQYCPLIRHVPPPRDNPLHDCIWLMEQTFAIEKPS